MDAGVIKETLSRARLENGGLDAVAVLKEHLSKEGEWTDEMQTNWEKALIAVATIMMEAANRPALFREELALAGYDEHGNRLSKTGSEGSEETVAASRRTDH